MGKVVIREHITDPPCATDPRYLGGTWRYCGVITFTPKVIMSSFYPNFLLACVKITNFLYLKSNRES